METKHCFHCGRDLPRSQFYKDKNTKDGVTAYCKDYYAAYYKQNRARQMETNRRARIRRDYGLALEEYDALIAQGCTICGETEKRIVLDHCHATNAVRAPLCDQCNHMLGNARDNPALLHAGAAYLERHIAA